MSKLEKTNTSSHTGEICTNTIEDLLNDELDKKLISIKNYLNESDILLNYVQLKSLIENVKNHKNPIEIVQQYTNNIEAFIKFIQEDVYPNVRNQSIKHRCTSLLKSIANPNDNYMSQETPTNSDNE